MLETNMHTHTHTHPHKFIHQLRFPLPLPQKGEYKFIIISKPSIVQVGIFFKSKGCVELTGSNPLIWLLVSILHNPMFMLLFRSKRHRIFFNDHFNKEFSLPLVSCHGARRCYRRSPLSNQLPSKCIYTLLGWDNFLLCLRKETHTPQKHIPLTHTHIPNVITFCLEQSKCLRDGMTAPFYWCWKRRGIKQVSAGTAEMHCFHDSYFKNDAMRPTMQSRVCSGLAKV